MVLIEKLSLKNWPDEVRVPENIMVVRKANQERGREIGIIRHCFDDIPYDVPVEFEIITVSGRSFGRFRGIEELILRWQHIFDFFYIEIKP
jgi:hypothetical protein